MVITGFAKPNAIQIPHLRFVLARSMDPLILLDRRFVEHNETFRLVLDPLSLFL